MQQVRLGESQRCEQTLLSERKLHGFRVALHLSTNVERKMAGKYPPHIRRAASASESRLVFKDTPAVEYRDIGEEADARTKIPADTHARPTVSGNGPEAVQHR